MPASSMVSRLEPALPRPVLANTSSRIVGVFMLAQYNDHRFYARSSVLCVFFIGGLLGRGQGGEAEMPKRIGIVGLEG